MSNTIVCSPYRRKQSSIAVPQCRSSLGVCRVVKSRGADIVISNKAHSILLSTSLQLLKTQNEAEEVDENLNKADASHTPENRKRKWRFCSKDSI